MAGDRPVNVRPREISHHLWFSRELVEEPLALATMMKCYAEHAEDATKRGLLRYTLWLLPEGLRFFVHCRSGCIRRLTEPSFEITRRTLRALSATSAFSA